MAVSTIELPLPRPTDSTTTSRESPHEALCLLKVGLRTILFRFEEKPFTESTNPSYPPTRYLNLATLYRYFLRCRDNSLYSTTPEPLLEWDNGGEQLSWMPSNRLLMGPNSILRVGARGCYSRSSTLRLAMER